MYKDYVPTAKSTLNIMGQSSKYPNTACLPNFAIHPNKSSMTISSRTQWNPKERNKKLHNIKATLQCNRRCSTVSPLQRHIQHHPTSVNPLLMRLSQARIFPHDRKCTIRILEGISTPCFHKFYYHFFVKYKFYYLRATISHPHA